MEIEQLEDWYGFAAGSPWKAGSAGEELGWVTPPDEEKEREDVNG